MRILSVTVRNCRLHRELKVDFDPSRTLIGGPNETGKSTFIEAMHRALFLKAKGASKDHKALISTLHTGHPEVDLTFEAGGHTYLLKKRFGSTGTTSLAPSNAASLSGDDAEEQLARLLSVESGISGKEMGIQWAHLWVWQGQAGDDPSEHATAQQNGLLQRLQQMGGAAALLSGLDARVANHFAEARDKFYTQAGKPKAGSALEQAEAAVSIASEELARASERVRKLDSAAADLESASRILLASGTSLTALEHQQEETELKTQQLGALLQKQAEQAPAEKEASDHYIALEQANQKIITTRGSISGLEESLKPQNEKISQLEKSRDEAKLNAAAADQGYGAATEAVRAARLRHELASAHAVHFEKKEIHTTLTGKEERVLKCRARLAELEGQFAKLSKVDKAKLNKIQKLESEYSNARAATKAMATGLEVVAADKPIKLGEQTIPVGQEQILTEDTEVSIGSNIRLRIQPGGGVSLAEARQAEEKGRTDLEAALDSLGLKSVQAATEVYANREDLDSRIKEVRAELGGMGAENLTEELQAAQNDVSAALADVERLTILASGVNVPDDKAAAKALAKALGEKLSEAEIQETQAKVVRDSAANVFAEAENVLNAARVQTEQQATNLTRLKAQLELLLNTHGDDTARHAAVIQLQAALTSARNQLKATTDAIAAIQPDFLEGDRLRIKRAIEQKTGERNDARTQIAVAQAALRLDGSEDPASDFAIAGAKAGSAREHRDSVQRKAQAIALLDQQFEEEKRMLAEQFTQPLADKISGYLQCIFGPGARAQVELQDNKFTGLKLFRPKFGNSPFFFHDLSGGAKEQTAAAVRLAMAEVLAGDHGGCLPVVFDDAFAYSDPDRVNHLQRMLDLAAARGLQVIVLTCNPADYASLGAKIVTLRSERYDASIRSNAVLESAMEASEANSPDSEKRIPGAAGSVEVTDGLRKALLDALTTAGGSKGNQALREALGWDDATYSAVKNDLVTEGKLISGKGRGGSVSLPPP
jgi:DNA repair exonuclease SbcCD ATPase subunit